MPSYRFCGGNFEECDRKLKRSSAVSGKKVDLVLSSFAVEVSPLRARTTTETAGSQNARGGSPYPRAFLSFKAGQLARRIETLARVKKGTFPAKLLKKRDLNVQMPKHQRTVYKGKTADVDFFLRLSSKQNGHYTFRGFTG